MDRVRASLLIAALSCGACSTSLRPVKCEGGPYRCNEGLDVKFCESEVVASKGADCAELGLVPMLHFCVVTQTTCVDTDYEVKDRDCKILKYNALKEWRECSPGTPTFTP